MALRYSKVLVTGGSGFIGGHLVEELTRQGAEVTAVSRGGVNAVDAAKALRSAHYLAMDVRADRFEALLRKQCFEAIYHMAGPASVPQSVVDPVMDFESNLGVGVRLLDAVRRACPQSRVVLASSAAVYGNPTRLPMKETDAPAPISPYGAAKLALERYAEVYRKLYTMPVASLRFFSVYGPRQTRLVVYDLMNKLHNTPHTLSLIGDGTETRDLIYVRDAVRAAITVMEKGKLDGEVYNVATGAPHTILDIARAISDGMGLNPRIALSGQRRAGDPAHWSADIGRLRKLGFTSESDLQQGIADTIAWFQSRQEAAP